MPTEPSKNFFKYFIIFLTVNIIFSVAVYLVSPAQVPAKFTPSGFENYRSRTSILYTIPFQLILFLLALIFYKLMPPMLRMYPTRYQSFCMRFSGLLLGINPEGLNIEILISKYISVLILTMSALLIPINLVSLGFSLEISNLYSYLIVYLALNLILIIPLFRFFSKKLQ